MRTLASMRRWARTLKQKVLAVYLAARDPRTPWLARAVALLVAGYALSPIDLIPDFIPILGYLDDLLLVPLGLALAIKLIPREVFEDANAQAARWSGRPSSRVAAAMIVGLWSLAAIAFAMWFGRGRLF